MVKKSCLSGFVLSWLKVGEYYAANRSETKISVRHLLFDNKRSKSWKLPNSVHFKINSKVDFQSFSLLTLIS